MSLIMFMICGLGLFSGVLNTMAGGASLLTLPALMSIGLAVDVANGTNRVGLLSLSLVAAVQFYRAGDLKLHSIFIYYILWMTLGSFIGTYAALALNPLWFRALAAVVILIMLGLSIFVQKNNSQKVFTHNKSQFIWYFFIGLYAGWIHAGVGILLMMLFMMQGYGLRQTNALKTFLISIFTLPTCMIYIYKGFINWNYCLALIVSGAIGSWIGVRFFSGKYQKTSKAFMTLSTLFAVWKMVQPIFL